jgi:hypothetical protein
MKGRKVFARGVAGTVSQWEPLSSGMCDALVTFEDGRSCWFASHELRPNDDLGPLPSRSGAIEIARAVSERQLKAIRAQHVADFHKPWPGCEHGKAIVGLALDGALAEVAKKPV